jgi:hypothetical protein
LAASVEGWGWVDCFNGPGNRFIGKLKSDLLVRFGLRGALVAGEVVAEEAANALGAVVRALDEDLGSTAAESDLSGWVVDDAGSLGWAGRSTSPTP